MQIDILEKIKNIEFIGSWQILLNDNIAIKRIGMVCTYIQIPKFLNNLQKSEWRRDKTPKRIQHHITFNHSEKGKIRMKKYQDSHKDKINEAGKKRLSDLGFINQKKWVKLNYFKNLEIHQMFDKTDKRKEYLKNYRKTNRKKINEVIARISKTPRGKLLIYESRMREFEKIRKNFNDTIEFEVANLIYKWSKLVRRRDMMCLVCRSKENLEAHHLIHKAICPKLMFNLNNGITLCVDCHDEHHYGKQGGIKKSLNVVHNDFKENKMECVALLG